MTILVTGGTGFIGSHTAISLIEAGYDIVILDNLCNSSINILPRLKQITGKDIPFYQGDIRDRTTLQKIFAEHKIETVMHFAGLKAVGESNALPMKYYDYNVSGSLILGPTKWPKQAYSALYSARRLRFTATLRARRLQRICRWAAPPTLTAPPNIWLNAFWPIFKKPIRAGA